MGRVPRTGNVAGCIRTVRAARCFWASWPFELFLVGRSHLQSSYKDLKISLVKVLESPGRLIFTNRLEPIKNLSYLFWPMASLNFAIINQVLPVFYHIFGSKIVKSLIWYLSWIHFYNSESAMAKRLNIQMLNADWPVEWCCHSPPKGRREAIDFIGRCEK